MCAKIQSKKTNAKLGYVQSDEISLGWENMNQAPFDGRLFKLTSVLTSIATTSFILNCLKYTKLKERVERLFPNFDCRVFQVPNMIELANCFIWRENDATKNAISAVAQANFSHSELQGKSSAEMQEMYFQKTGKNFNDLDSVLKRGSYFKRFIVEKKLDKEILDKIPENKIPKDGIILRNEIQLFSLPIMSRVENKVETYFYDETPIIRQ